ncbi:het domain-containing protein [Colletotrichum sojae]|uniref:Het domain-containing protein n=1 Tax=Colletotrichum sojae TaxID=2175907 RepID=A0A8H6MKB5_9PEZI|nr:het domain-containing protein [Colletotrichum sojae]
MRLIDTQSLSLQEDDEVSFQDMTTPGAASKKTGWAKTAKTYELARARGLTHAWVDTCCVDKSSIAEPIEANNSMFRWYEASAVCEQSLPGSDAAQSAATIYGFPGLGKDYEDTILKEVLGRILKWPDFRAKEVRFVERRRGLSGFWYWGRETTCVATFGARLETDDVGGGVSVFRVFLTGRHPKSSTNTSSQPTKSNPTPGVARRKPPTSSLLGNGHSITPTVQKQ